MATTVEHTTNRLNSLAESCIDSRKGFSTAAERVDSPDLSTMLRRRSTERQSLADELRSKVSQLGGDPEDTGSVTGKAHRGWMKLRDAATATSNKDVLAECERGEEHIRNEYERAIKDEDLEPSARVLVQNQYDRIKSGHEQIRSTRERIEAAG